MAFLKAYSNHDIQALNSFVGKANSFDIDMNMINSHVNRGKYININVVMTNTSNETSYLLPIKITPLSFRGSREEHCIDQLEISQYSDNRYMMNGILDSGVKQELREFCIQTLKPKDKYIYTFGLKNGCKPGRQKIRIEFAVPEKFEMLSGNIMKISSKWIESKDLEYSSED